MDKKEVDIGFYLELDHEEKCLNFVVQENDREIVVPLQGKELIQVRDFVNFSIRQLEQ